MSRGIIYILTNPAMPNLIKVGKTSVDRGYEKRISELYSTGVPFPFDCEYACIVDNYEEVEKRIHSAFAGNRVNLRREFFELSPLKIIDILKLLNHERIDIETEYEDVAEEQASERAQEINQRRENFRFSDYNIKVGTTLYYIPDNSITAEVANEKNKITFREEEHTPFSASQILEQERGNAGVRNGYWLWSLDGEESLREMRLRVDEENND